MMNAYFGHVWLVRLRLQRGMAAIHLLAFLTVAFQFKPLLDEHGVSRWSARIAIIAPPGAMEIGNQRWSIKWTSAVGLGARALTH